MYKGCEGMWRSGVCRTGGIQLCIDVVTKSVSHL